RPLPPPLLARRDAAAPERGDGRDEPDRAATADPRRGQAHRRVGPEAPPAEARYDGPVAGAGPQRDPVRGDGQARLPLRDDVVDRERPAAPDRNRARRLPRRARPRVLARQAPGAGVASLDCVSERSKTRLLG